MTEEQIKHMTDMNYRVLLLLGYATSIIAEIENDPKCDWFLKAIEAVVYQNKGLPPFPKS